MASIQKLPSGKWRAQVRRNGAYKGQTFTLKRDAEAWARKIESQTEHIAATGFQPVPDGYTVRELVELYMQECNTGGKTKTATLKMLTRTLGHLKLKNLNAIALRSFMDARLADGAGGVTVAADLSFLGSVFKWARHARHLDVDVALTVQARQSLSTRKVDTRSNERERMATEGELTALYAHWDSNTRQKIPMSQICRFALATAMRQEEICNLDFADLDVKNRTVVIRDRKDPKRKVGNHQTVPLLPDAWEIVEDVMNTRTSGKLFPFLAASVSTAFTRACQRLKIEDLHFHDLRHAAVSSFFNANLSIAQVALMSGHKTWAQLRRYTHTQPSDVHKAFQEYLERTATK